MHPDLPIPVFFFRFPPFFRFEVFLVFLRVFAFFSKDFMGSAERNILFFSFQSLKNCLD